MPPRPKDAPPDPQSPPARTGGRGTGGRVDSPRVPTGVLGLDEVLLGGLPAGTIYLVRGRPGTGKTTFALQFILAGARAGEDGLFVTTVETADELEDNAASYGLSLAGPHAPGGGRVTVMENVTGEEVLRPDQQYTVFEPSEVESGHYFKSITDRVEEVRPKRLVLDSVGHLRLLVRDPLLYRRQMAALKQFLRRHVCTAVFTDEVAREGDDVTRLSLETLATGIIELEQLPADYGPARRRLEVVKLHGAAYRGGHHDLTITTGGGMAVHPRLVAAEHHADAELAPLTSGVAGFDEIVGGGLEFGTTTLLLGAAGSGKSSIAALYAVRAVAAGQRAVMFLFEESVPSVLARADGLGIDLRAAHAEGRLVLHSLDPAVMSPGEFSGLVRRSVEREGANLVVLDSLNGYFNAMPDERFLLLHLRELFMYLRHRGVLTLCALTQHGLPGVPGGTGGGGLPNAVGVSYLADNVILLRYYEFAGRVNQAIGVTKKRSGPHQRTLREFSLGPDGIRVGPPLTHLHGILTGVPTYTADAPPKTAPMP